MIYQRTGGQNIDSPVQHRPSLSAGGSSRERESPPRADVATVLSHPTAIRGFLGHHRCSRESLWGWHWWEQRDQDWDGDQGGYDMCPASGVPSEAAGIPCCNSTFPGKEGLGERRRGLVPRLNFIHPSTVSQVAFRIRKPKKYIHRCSLVYLLTLCNLFALICFCLPWDFPF